MELGLGYSRLRVRAKDMLRLGTSQDRDKCILGNPGMSKERFGGPGYPLSSGLHGSASVKHTNITCGTHVGLFVIRTYPLTSLSSIPHHFSSPSTHSGTL